MLVPLSLLIQAAATDPVPSDNDVKAGWLAFGVVLALIVVVVFLLRSFTKQLKKVERANEAGVYDEQPASDPAPPPTTVEGER